MTFWVLTFIAEMLEVKGTLYFFDTFMEKRDGGYRNRYRFFVYCGVLYLAAVTGVWIGMLKCILIILVMSFLNLAYYEVSFRQSFLFSIINYTMLVLIDYVTVLLGRGGSIQEKWFLQALISKTAFIILMLFIRRFSKTRKSYGLITGKEWFQFFCVPVFTVVGFILMFYLKLECEDHKLIFAIRNPVTEKVEIENDTIKSKRGDHHGIGLLNVKAVVDKYGGDMVLSCDENEFKAVVIL